MVNEEEKELSDAAINNMFSGIGRAKEETARSIMEKLERDENDARKKRGRFLFGSYGNDFDEDTDLDEIERRIDEELEIARRGKLMEVKKSDDIAPPVTPIIMDFDNSLQEEDILFEFTDETEETAHSDSVDSFLNDIDKIFDSADCPETSESVNIDTEEEVADDFEIMDIYVPEINHAYLSVVSDTATNKSAYAFSIVLSDGTAISDNALITNSSSRETAFLGAIELFKRIQMSKITTLIIHAEPDVGNLLRRNATYGIVDEYSEGCAQYISLAKELAGKCFIRITNNFPNLENTQVAIVSDTAESIVYKK